MTPTAFRAALAALGLSQRGFALLVGLDPRSVRRWTLGEVFPPPWAGYLVALMVAHRAAGLPLHKPAQPGLAPTPATPPPPA